MRCINFHLKKNSLKKYDRENAMFEIGKNVETHISDYSVMVKHGWILYILAFLLYTFHHQYLIVDFWMNHP